MAITQFKHKYQQIHLEYTHKTEHHTPSSITQNFTHISSWRIIKIRGNCNLPTCGLACFNNAHPWFKSFHLTHLRWALLDPRYPPLPFPLENLIYYISQHQNTIKTLETGLSSFPLSTFEPSKIPKPIIPFTLYFDCQNLIPEHLQARRRCAEAEAWVFVYIGYEMSFQGLPLLCLLFFSVLMIDEGDSD